MHRMRNFVSQKFSSRHGAAPGARAQNEEAPGGSSAACGPSSRAFPKAGPGVSLGAGAERAQLEELAKFVGRIEVFLSRFDRLLTECDGMHRDLGDSLNIFFSRSTGLRETALELVDALAIFRVVRLELQPHIERTRCAAAERMRKIRRAEVLAKERNNASQKLQHYTKKLSRLKSEVPSGLKAQERVTRNENKLQRASTEFYIKEEAARTEVHETLATRYTAAAQLVSKALLLSRELFSAAHPSLARLPPLLGLLSAPLEDAGTPGVAAAPEAHAGGERGEAASAASSLQGLQASLPAAAPASAHSSVPVVARLGSFVEALRASHDTLPSAQPSPASAAASAPGVTAPSAAANAGGQAASLPGVSPQPQVGGPSGLQSSQPTGGVGLSVSERPSGPVCASALPPDSCTSAVALNETGKTESMHFVGGGTSSHFIHQTDEKSAASGGLGDPDLALAGSAGGGERVAPELAGPLLTFPSSSCGPPPAGHESQQAGPPGAVGSGGGAVCGLAPACPAQGGGQTPQDSYRPSALPQAAAAGFSPAFPSSLGGTSHASLHPAPSCEGATGGQGGSANCHFTQTSFAFSPSSARGASSSASMAAPPHRPAAAGPNAAGLASGALVGDFADPENSRHAAATRREDEAAVSTGKKSVAGDSSSVPQGARDERGEKGSGALSKKLSWGRFMLLSSRQHGDGKRAGGNAAAPRGGKGGNLESAQSASDASRFSRVVFAGDEPAGTPSGPSPHTIGDAEGLDRGRACPHASSSLLLDSSFIGNAADGAQFPATTREDGLFYAQNATRGPGPTSERGTGDSAVFPSSPATPPGAAAAPSSSAPFPSPATSPYAGAACDASPLSFPSQSASAERGEKRDPEGVSSLAPSSLSGPGAFSRGKSDSFAHPFSGHGPVAQASASMLMAARAWVSASEELASAASAAAPSREGGLGLLASQSSLFSAEQREAAARAGAESMRRRSSDGLAHASPRISAKDEGRMEPREREGEERTGTADRRQNEVGLLLRASSPAARDSGRLGADGGTYRGESFSPFPLPAPVFPEGGSRTPPRLRTGFGEGQLSTLLDARGGLSGSPSSRRHSSGGASSGSRDSSSSYYTTQRGSTSSAFSLPQSPSPVGGDLPAGSAATAGTSSRRAPRAGHPPSYGGASSVAPKAERRRLGRVRSAGESEDEDASRCCGDRVPSAEAAAGALRGKGALRAHERQESFFERDSVGARGPAGHGAGSSNPPFSALSTGEEKTPFPSQAPAFPSTTPRLARPPQEEDGGRTRVQASSETEQEPEDESDAKQTKSWRKQGGRGGGRERARPRDRHTKGDDGRAPGRRGGEGAPPASTKGERRRFSGGDAALGDPSTRGGFRDGDRRGRDNADASASSSSAAASAAATFRLSRTRGSSSAGRISPPPEDDERDANEAPRSGRKRRSWAGRLSPDEGSEEDPPASAAAGRPGGKRQGRGRRVEEERDASSSDGESQMGASASDNPSLKSSEPLTTLENGRGSHPGSRSSSCRRLRHLGQGGSGRKASAGEVEEESSQVFW
ncbi:hypothetical protein BESB_079570 [Besnoitia besnoiti]|uniref:BAR domain-containing protein n=1 Tax=Besnoitia besnoiti TaxID=94643 RepID=A0A2A9MBQ1_BESBE|nr:hypothetical protein BESB_079570 [Besnoitia besnoiti]PFH33741.1 hypothetical protein BESB_079570 [Besnoitia besnoiti]